MLGNLLKPECEELIQKKDWASLRDAFSEMDPADIAEVLEDLPAADTGIVFRLLPRAAAAAAFEYLPVDQQSEIVSMLSNEQMVNVLNEMAPDDRTRLFEELPAEVTKRALTTLRPDELKVARQLLGYPERSAGRYMTPEYLAVRPSLTAKQTLEYLRKNSRGRETLNVIYLIDDKGVLIEDLRLSTLVLTDPEQPISEIHDRPLVSIQATADRAEVVSAFEKYDRTVLPVTDSRGVLLGIITVDDVLDVAEEEATEDIQKLGGMEALDAPYLEIGAFEMIRKRGGWLAVLFIGEMFTATAMAEYEDELARATVLALFIPLIISSGGNAGSQAASLIIRALSVRDVHLADWWKVMRRELGSSLMLGVALGLIGMARVLLWPGRVEAYGEHYVLLGVTVAFSLLGVVMFGSLCGSMLPFLLRRFGLDPATASTPFVATLVDVAGVIIYFSVASYLLAGTLL
jgi:magnesium transporter